MNYVVTPHALFALEKLLFGLGERSSLRAWRITGDYGSGKSSFALFAANVLNKRRDELTEFAGRAFFKDAEPKILPILITGFRGSIGSAILKAFLNYFNEFQIQDELVHRIQRLVKENIPVSDETIIQTVREFKLFIVKHKIADGLAIFIDEAGKFLEYAATHPEQEDIYLLQSLAEMAARSGKSPFILITILHQGITAYAERLSKGEQREWEKIAGRFEEILWHHPLDQVALLIAHSLNVDASQLPKTAIDYMDKAMRLAIKQGWYGYQVNSDSLHLLAEALYPVDPYVIPILVRLFLAFGQNERSLFSFLLGSEDFGLQEFVLKSEGLELFRLHNLYDYARSTFGAKMASLSFHWKAIDDAILNFNTVDEQELEIIKTVGLINLINSDTLIPSNDIIVAATGSSGAKIDRLVKKHIIYFRGHAGYCIWPHTSVNIEDCYKQAIIALGPDKKDIKLQLKEKLSTRPIVARRHYIETGNLRYFEVKYLDLDELRDYTSSPSAADGKIIVPLCETESDVTIAENLAIEITNANNLIIVVPGPLQYLAENLDEVRRWEWIERSVGELRHDRFAREEVSRQLSLANNSLQRTIENLIGLNSFSSESELKWYYGGHHQQLIANNRQAMSFLADICDNTFVSSPKFNNELVNRRELSSAAASARLRLCERLFDFADKPFLNMDPEKHPPEMSMYLSVLTKAGFHAMRENGNWEITLPQADYDAAHCNVLPTMGRINEMLTHDQNGRVQITDLFDSLKAAPYGVRDGLIPLLLAIFIVINEQSVALYEDGSFIPRISGSNYLRLMKAPETFEIQFYPITTLRTSLFSRLAKELGLNRNKENQVVLLDIVKPLFQFMGGMPEYVVYTKSLSAQAIKVRDVLTKSRDPIKLLFHDLPDACDIKKLNTANIDNSDIDDFSLRLKAAIDEMRQSYPGLLQDLLKQLLDQFNLKGSFEANRDALAKRAKDLVPFVTEIRLKSYCLRLADTILAPEKWAESLANLLCAMPATKWREKDQQKFALEIHQLTQQFLRVEATVYNPKKFKDDGLSVRVSLTRSNGQERDQVIHLTNDEAELAAKLEKHLQHFLNSHGQVGIAAASSVLWNMLSDNDKLKKS